MKMIAFGTPGAAVAVPENGPQNGTPSKVCGPVLRAGKRPLCLKNRSAFSDKGDSFIHMETVVAFSVAT